MARPARGHEFVDAAITQAKTISELLWRKRYCCP